MLHGKFSHPNRWDSRVQPDMTKWTLKYGKGVACGERAWVTEVNPKKEAAGFVAAEEEPCDGAV